MPFRSIGVLQDVDLDRNGNLLTQQFGAGNKPVLIMMWASYCGHCHKAQPAFGQLFDNHGQKKVFLATIQTDDQDPGVQALMKRFPGILRQHGVVFNGVPTYVLYSNGKYREYQGGRDLRSLQNFIDSI